MKEKIGESITSRKDYKSLIQNRFGTGSASCTWCTPVGLFHLKRPPEHVRLWEVNSPFATLKVYDDGRQNDPQMRVQGVRLWEADFLIEMLGCTPMGGFPPCSRPKVYAYGI